MQNFSRQSKVSPMMMENLELNTRTDHEVELPPIVADSTPRSSVVKLENKRLRIMIGYSHVDSDFCHQLVDALEEDYQASKSCRQEVMNAKGSLKKRFVPVYLTRDFVTSSQLGVRIVGPQHIRFGKKPFDVTIKDLIKLILEDKGEKNLKTNDSKVSVIEPPSETKEDENNKSNEDSSKQDPENSNQPIHEIKSISKPTETCNSQDIADWFVANKVRPELKKMYDFQCGTELLLYGQ
ncbi:unnamed protein product [Rotaria magnacalcarata]